jgi:hypothetical protein
MYKLIPWTVDLDLSEFYSKAEERGFYNNSNERSLIQTISNEREYQLWILYYNDIIVGCVAAHSIDEGYRICARTCVLTDLIPTNSLRTRNQIITHQHITAQFFIPACIEWVNGKGDMYITTHPSSLGTQRLVHNIYAPSLVKTNVLAKAFEKEYRGHAQTFWKLNPDEFLSQLSKVKSWQ